MKKIKIIIDTDIGNDIDDTWALTFALACNLFDVKLICLTHEDLEYKTKLTAKILQRCKREDIPIAKGAPTNSKNNAQEEWISGFSLGSYSGKIFDDSCEAINDVLTQHPETIIVALGPLTNITNYIKRYPKFSDKLNIIAMGGAVYKGYINQSVPSAECNVALDPDSFNFALEQTNTTLIPLDVCRDFFINGVEYQKIINSTTCFGQVVTENYQVWHKNYRGGAIKFDIENSSSILFDLLPMLYLIKSESFGVENLKLVVTTQGHTNISPDGTAVNCAVERKDTQLLKEFVAKVLE